MLVLGHMLVDYVSKLAFCFQLLLWLQKAKEAVAALPPSVLR